MMKYLVSLAFMLLIIPNTSFSQENKREIDKLDIVCNSLIKYIKAGISKISGIVIKEAKESEAV